MTHPQDRAALAAAIQRLDNSIAWLRDGKRQQGDKGLGVDDMVLIRAALAAAPAPAELQALENVRLYAARHRKEEWAATVLRFLSDAGVKGSPLRDAPKATEKDINRWQALIQERPAGPWEMGNGGSFDRTTIKPISDDMLEELAHWLSMGYTPWNGRSMPLSDRDRQFMYLLYYSVQGLVSRMRAAEKAALPAPAQQPADTDVTDAMVTAYLTANDAYWQAVDAMPAEQRNPSKFRNGTPREATRLSLAAALAAQQPAQPAEPVNGIAANWFHGEGAIAQCVYCKRYTLNRRALTDNPPPCDCGERHGWTGSFKAPGPDAKWFGPAPAAPVAQQVAAEPAEPKCETCNGEGEVQKSQRIGESDFEEWSETCPVCDGAATAPAHVQRFVGMLVAHNKAQYDTIIKQQAKLMIGTPAAAGGQALSDAEPSSMDYGGGPFNSDGEEGPERYTLDQIAHACMAAEVPDSKFESIAVALQDDITQRTEQKP